jgi:hypothetical protein
MTLSLLNKKGMVVWAGDDRGALLKHLAVLSSSPPRGGTRPYRVEVRVPDRPTTVFHLVMDAVGGVVVTEVRWHQSLSSLTLEEALQDLPSLPLPAYRPPPPKGRNVWLRLRDPWPPPEPEALPEPPPGISICEWASFLRWDPITDRAKGAKE